MERWNDKYELVGMKKQVSKLCYEIVLDVILKPEMLEDYREKLKWLRWKNKDEFSRMKKMWWIDRD